MTYHVPKDDLYGETDEEKQQYFKDGGCSFEAKLCATAAEMSRVRYIVWGREVGAGGAMHLQMFCYLEEAKSLTALKKQIGMNTLHLEVSKDGKAGYKNAIDYCKKDGKFFEWGELPAQGKRSDLMTKLSDVTELMVNKPTEVNMHTIAASAPDVYVRNYGGLIRLQTELLPPRDFKTRIHWYYGPTGTGKSHTARAESGPDAYYKPGGNDWFDGYSGEQHVVFEDFRKGWFTFDQLLRLCDRYPLRLPVKGSFVQFVATDIWITTNKSVRDMFGQWTDARGETHDREDIEQLVRRVEDERFFGTRYVEPIEDGVHETTGGGITVPAPLRTFSGRSSDTGTAYTPQHSAHSADWAGPFTPRTQTSEQPEDGGDSPQRSQRVSQYAGVYSPLSLRRTRSEGANASEACSSERSVSRESAWLAEACNYRADEDRAQTPAPRRRMQFVDSDNDI